jgi:hypothetical protein
VPDPANAGDRAKAYRLRKVKPGKLPPIDALWLGEYEDKAKDRERAKARDVGGSRRRSGRRIKLDVEEHEEAEAVGTGAAAAAAAAALATREEGRRLDSLTIESVGALKEAVACYREICISMKDRMEILEETHIEMLGSVREQYLARTQAEINAMEAASGGDPMTKLAEQFLPDILRRANGAKPT